MNSTLTVDLETIEQPGPRTSDARKLREATQQLNQASYRVKTQWNELSEEEREAYSDLASLVTSTSAERKTNPIVSLWRRFRVGVNLLIIGIRGEQEAYVQYAVAFGRFIESILSAIETESPEYKHTVSSAINEINTISDKPIMTAEEAREQRRALLDQIYR